MAKGNFNRYGNRTGGRQNYGAQRTENRVPERDVINPYTFVPVSEKEPLRKEPEMGALSGYMDCMMQIKTPVFIPNTTGKFSDADTEGHMHRVFYSYEDLTQEKAITEEIRLPKNPVIPGSEIRGMLRNVFEQLTNSCYVHIDESNLPFKRSAEPKTLCLLVWDETENGWRIYTDVEKNVYKGAIIHKNGAMFLENGFKGRYDIDDQYRYSYKAFDTAESLAVSFDTTSKKITKDSNGEWIVHIPTKMKSKMGGTWTANRQIVYTTKGLTRTQGVLLGAETMERFEYVLGVCEDVKGGYMDDAFNKTGESKTRTAIYAKRYRQKKPLIVYADKNSVDKKFKNEVIYLSPASITKEFFGETILSILEKNAKHQKCQSRAEACPACRLFGMAGQTSSLRGRVRFTDGEAKEFAYGQEITLPILATPKISATEFYLKKPSEMQEDGVWNYDYYTTYRGHGRSMQFIRHPYVAKLSGRKVYLTHKPCFLPAEKSKMNSSVTPIVSGSFAFRVYFDQLTAEEMEQLLFCIELTKEPNDTQSSDNPLQALKAFVGVPDKGFHKIGGAKPLGWGAVELTVQDITCISYALQDGKLQRMSETYVRDKKLRKEIENTGEAKQIMRYALTEDIEPEMVRYPTRPDKQGDRKVFLWFSQNRGSIAAPKIQQTLPSIEDKNRKLKE